MGQRSLLHFLLRRACRATIFFVALLATIFAATSVYYLVRINMIEKQLTARTLAKKKAAAAGGDVGVTHAQRDEEEEEAQYAFQVMSRAAPTGDATGEPRLRCPAASAFRYTGLYRALSPDAPLSRQAVRNPTLPTSLPAYDDIPLENETGHGVGGAVRRVLVPDRQRYLLRGLEPGRQYMLRLSFLGSPSVGFDMALYQVRQSQLLAAEAAMGDGEGVPGRTLQGWAASPQDTELRVFATSPDNAGLFSEAEEVWIDAALLEADGEAGEEEDVEGEGSRRTVSRRILTAAKAAEDPFLPVVEVRPRTLSVPVNVSRLPVVRFNIALDPFSASFLPQVAVPLMTYVVWAVVFLGYVLVYTCVSSGIAGGRPHTD